MICVAPKDERNWQTSQQKAGVAKPTPLHNYIW